MDNINITINCTKLYFITFEIIVTYLNNIIIQKL